MLVLDFAGVLLHHEAAKGATEIRPQELLRCARRRKDNCLLFRTIGKSNRQGQDPGGGWFPLEPRRALGNYNQPPATDEGGTPPGANTPVFWIGPCWRWLLIIFCFAALAVALYVSMLFGRNVAAHKPSEVSSIACQRPTVARGCRCHSN
jgi:hypothetical protein